MKRYLAAISVFGLMLFACNKHKNLPHYTISKIAKSDTANKVNVHIDSRLTTAQLVDIAGKIKSDSSKLTNLQLVFLLPGNGEASAGPNSYYASAKYLSSTNITASDTLKDADGDVLRLKIFGLSENKARQLLGVTHAELTGKKIIGKFIDDYNHTVIIPFNDVMGKNDLYVIELDSSGKVVSATMPLIVNQGNLVKWEVDQRGDYMTLKDSVLSQFSIDDLGVPYYSIKEGK